MKVGLTYDLRQSYLDMGYGEEETAEFDRIDTIEAIEQTLRHLGYDTERIGNILDLTDRLSRGDRWDIVFNIAEGLRGIGREAQVPALLDAYDIPYTFSDPLVLALTLHKGMTKRVLRDLGIPTPDFAEIHSEEDISKVRLPYPLFAKPAAEGTGKGINPASIIKGDAELHRVCRELLARYKQPALVETFLPGREFTAAIAGTGSRARVLGVMEIFLKSNAEADVYSYSNKEESELYVDYALADDALARDAARTALEAWAGLGCRDAGRVDLRADARGVANVIEVNPLAGIHPHHSDLPIICNLAGISYVRLFEMIMESARARLPGRSFKAGKQGIPASIRR
ncbi:MAG: D-alanine--D-alanine ligase [Acidobacteria bacterium]|nr:D-alanine--D-alanine ligase [Acidobacteriota bacterium]